MFDGLYALAVSEAVQDSVSQISDGAYGRGAAFPIDAFQTGAFWTYVWTRDLAYSTDLALAQFDPPRAVNSLLFKASVLKAVALGGERSQIVQDTGSGGSYPVSSDRVVWALGAKRALEYLSAADRARFLTTVFPILCDTIEQDRRLVFDETSGLYRGEQSFLDWREQTYPGWTRDDVLPIAMSKALSTNALDDNLLQTAAELAGRCGRPDLQSRYQGWADALKARINARFWDADAGLYATYLLSDGINDVRVSRYDLLGECLTILFGIADPPRAESVLGHYPTGPLGPPVVWPQERSVPIYHNQAMWPFVTAYWVRAGQRVGNAAVIDAGENSLRDQAALNLSNMENYDLVTGSAQVKQGARTGPAVDSRRQLWSVAGYLSTVQSVVFGEEADWEGIRFRPCITTKMRASFPGDTIELRNFTYRRTQHTVRVHLPELDTRAAGILAIDHSTLNGSPVSDDFVSAAQLRADNTWEIYLAPPSAAGSSDSRLRVVNVNDERAIFAPPQPRWSADGGLSRQDGHVVLTYASPADPPVPADVSFRIYRDGDIYSVNVTSSTWTDPQPVGRGSSHGYQVAAVDRRSGNVSHLSPSRSDATSDQMRPLAARELLNSGGTLVDGDHFEHWGAGSDTLTSRPITVDRDGQYALRVRFSNGNGPVNTGLCCGVKRIEICTATIGEVLADGYAVMPQSGDWTRWDLSSPVRVNLMAGQRYVVRLFQDDTCRNMSFLKANERYTGQGGGLACDDFVNVAGFELSFLHAAPATPAPGNGRMLQGVVAEQH